ncbi:TetR/AcrR family transcriptional regulator [Streptomyces sp. TS71-3]|uniref:TetR/AcrR family transcriptional regulator n=1 Tax=Streptomyces sp. TS71-3 TaxID=2733862 RepID=UPI001B261EFD|nr:TetR/AcrR family transcriptional regulator [Streptomyces sp. TS71-3]GHJ34668.1 TetR family transcriptional regulator [Streptomyces sp. TS71-3]
MSSGLRERKKAATRLALHDAAVRLAGERGVENLTVEAIADAATVSRRTFSNYFASKEQALLHRDRASVSRLVDAVRARPAHEPPVTALLRAAEHVTAGYTADPAKEERYWELRRHPALLAEIVATYAAAEADLAEAVGRRLPADATDPLRARVIAATFLAALRVAGQAALGNHDANYADRLRHAFTLAREGFTGEATN